ncbi:hypothetical protein [Tellurirhabdus bombi]|uniref:hypothetical protein n=1 Tax=Tellurirhabdus bombi TaxID=2907205 RepID=UPI001F3E7EDC|nr:hypothetical protein [Tellurirhabdus bombi]
MKEKKIRFFSPQDNEETKPKPAKEQKEAAPTASISLTGRLIFPIKTIEKLDVNPETTRFRVGVEEGKRKVKSLYLVPATDDSADVFELVKIGRSYTIPLQGILKNLNLDYTTTLFIFSVKSFDYEDSARAFELALTEQQERVKKEGEPKKRGRKPASAKIEE